MVHRRIYISGPMRGRPDHNRAAFAEAADALRGRGFPVVSPVEINESWAADMAARGLRITAADYLRRDLVELLQCDAILLLPGWQESVGARCEVAVAFTLGYEILDFTETTAPAREAATSRVIIHRDGYKAPPGALESLDVLREENIAWANATFGNGAERRRSCWKHMEKEVGELLEAPDDVEEMADVFLLLAHGSQGLDLAGAVRAKLEKNKRRTWGTPDADGVVEHVEQGGTDVG